MPDIAPGKEEEFRYLRRWLAVSDRVDGLIAAAERPQEGIIVRDRIYVEEKLRELNRERRRPPIAIPMAAVPAVAPRGLRAGFASRLARVALALHREAAAGAVLRPETERPR